MQDHHQVFYNSHANATTNSKNEDNRPSTKITQNVNKVRLGKENDSSSKSTQEHKTTHQTSPTNLVGYVGKNSDDMSSSILFLDDSSTASSLDSMLPLINYDECTVCSSDDDDSLFSRGLDSLNTPTSSVGNGTNKAPIKNEVDDEKLLDSDDKTEMPALTTRMNDSFSPDDNSDDDDDSFLTNNTPISITIEEDNDKNALQETSASCNKQEI